MSNGGKSRRPPKPQNNIPKKGDMGACGGGLPALKPPSMPKSQFPQAEMVACAVQTSPKAHTRLFFFQPNKKLTEINVKRGSLLLDDQTLFKDESVFTPTYVPTDFRHRDGQLKALAASIKPGLRSQPPMNTLLYGPPATGKTTAVKFMLKEVKETSHKLLPVYVNCEDATTPYAVFAKIHEALFDVYLPDTGKPLESVKEKVFKKLSKDGRSLAVFLDEFDALLLNSHADKVLVDLLKASDTYGYSQVGVVAIMIDAGALSRLDDKTKSVFNPLHIHFAPYGEDEFRDILKDRVRYGLYADVFSEGALDAVVAETVKRGDLRFGIQLMRQAVYEAEKEAVKAVTEKHVYASASRQDSAAELSSVLSALSDEDKALLLTIAELKDPVSGRVYEVYRRKTGVGIKKYNELVKKLEHLRIIDALYVEGVHGRTRRLIPRFDVGDIRRLLGGGGGS
ncbi:ORC1-type DNA replication protein 2 [uncultured archaeon]|nr:ORC1-type DNA replication protein 2 [uncultured archaeon]